jgi:molybdate transport repressor ModE-like protein
MVVVTRMVTKIDERRRSTSADVRRIKWDDVRILMAIAECGSIRSGAESACISINTARAAITRLERVYRQPLITSSVAGTFLTERGCDLLAVARQMRDALILTLEDDPFR